MPAAWPAGDPLDAADVEGFREFPDKGEGALPPGYGAGSCLKDYRSNAQAKDAGINPGGRPSLWNYAALGALDPARFAE